MHTIYSPELEALSDQLKSNSKSNILDSLSAELKEKILTKKKLTISEQIEYMKIKGIQFNIVNENDAATYLSQNSYYYKVTAYRKNYIKDSAGKYKGLDFANLKDLAIIDMYLRYLVIQLSLDIEHALKTLIIRLITDIECNDDGFKIIVQYNNFEKVNFEKKISEESTLTEVEKNNKKKAYVPVQEKILKDIKNKRDYNYDLYIKNKDRLSIWILLEMMSLGQLVSFIRFYVDTSQHKSTQLKKAYNFLRFSKNIRDSAAHSRPVILNITEENQMGNTNQKRIRRAQLPLKDYLINSGVDSKLASRVLTNFKVHDLCSLLYLHDFYIQGKQTRKARKKELMKLYRRSLYKKSIYEPPTDFVDISKVFLCLLKNYKVNR